MKYDLKQFGYFDEKDQSNPVYDPGIIPCLMCGLPWDDNTVRTISIMALDKDIRDKSWFYRVHRDCDEEWKKENGNKNDPPSTWLMNLYSAN